MVEIFLQKSFYGFQQKFGMQRVLKHSARGPNVAQPRLANKLTEMQVSAKPYDTSSSQHIYGYLDFRASSGLDREPGKNGG